MTTSWTFTVPGVPVPQGSMRSVGPGRMVHSNAPALIDWRETVRHYASKEFVDGAISGPVQVVAVFYLPRPKSRPKRELHPDRKPDLDKLARAILDALTGPALVDDAQVCSLLAAKHYCLGTDGARASITVTSMAGQVG